MRVFCLIYNSSILFKNPEMEKRERLKLKRELQHKLQ